MYEEQSNPQTTTIRVTVAIVLIALAAALGVWLLTIVNATISDAKKPAMLQVICPEDTKSFDINTPAGRFEMPKPAFTGFAYFILYLFLIIPMSITLALLKGGISLLNPDLTKQLRQFIDTIRRTVPPKQ